MLWKKPSTCTIIKEECILTKSVPLLVKNDQIQRSVVIINDQGEHIIPYIVKVETEPNQGVHPTILAFIQKGLFHVTGTVVIKKG